MSLLLWAAFVATGEGQTSVDLRTQSKSVDFSGAASTKPMQVGGSLPSTCALGQFFFLTSAPAGSNVYACDVVNVWTLEGSTLAPGPTNELLSSSGGSTQWQALGGDIIGAPNSVTVKGLQGRAVGTTAPSNNQVLEWNAATNQWLPAAGETGNAAYVFVSQTSLTIPGTVHLFGTANLIVDCFDSETPPQQVEADKIQISPTTFNVTIDFATAQSGYCVVNGAGTASVSGGGGIPPVGGDLSGNAAAATVTGLQNRPVANTAPSSGQALLWNSTSSTWQPGTVTSGGAIASVFGRTGAVTALTGDYTFGQIAGTVGNTQLPGAGGDLSGTLTAATVSGIQSRAVGNTAPSNGQVLEWNAATNQWLPAAGETGNAAYVFVSQTSLTIPGTVHLFGTANLIVDCFDSESPPQRVEADKIQISPTTFNVTIDFATAQSGYCVVNGAGTASVSGGGGIPPVGGDLSGNAAAATVTGLQNRPVANTAPTSGQALVWNSTSSNWQPGTVAGGGSGGAITSVFGRTGVVTSLAGDYTFGQIAGTVGNTQLPGASGDLSGTLTAATVTGIQSRAVANTAPLSGQALLWNGSQWAPGAVPGGGGGGVTMAYQLGDLAVVLTSPNVLTIGAGCVSGSPCNVRFGYQVFTITNSATATISGNATGAAYIYISGSGTLVVGHNLTVACSASCTQQTGVTSFPANVIPIYTWTATNGAWNASGGLDQRSFLSSKVLAGGQGIIITETPGQSTLAVDNGVIPTYLTNSATLTFSSISNNACAPDQSLTVTGANPGDAVAPAWPSNLPSGVLGVMFVSSTNTVNVRLCNLSGAAVTPPSNAFRATIVRNY
jgi:hypothetical protein